MEENFEQNTKPEYSENFKFKEMWKLSTERLKAEEKAKKYPNLYQYLQNLQDPNLG
uniref:Uncharacterized protein n=1 Tax=Meloidogyne incognita TaxID=6306 RepID=A0A914KGW5_MELIC